MYAGGNAFMVTLVDKGVHLVNGAPVAAAAKDASARGRTMAYGILRAHRTSFVRRASWS